MCNWQGIAVAGIHPATGMPTCRPPLHIQRRQSMMSMIENSFQAMQEPVRAATEIGLRASAALARIGCDAGDRMAALHFGAMRTAMTGYADAAVQLATAEPHATVDPAIDATRQAVSYWRALVGLTTTTQAEYAEALMEPLSAWTRLLNSAADPAGTAGPAMPTLGIYSAIGTSALATMQAMCDQFAHSARQFCIDSGIDRDVAAGVGHVEEVGEARTRMQRKAA
jgi:hypothetical protein